MTKINKTVLVSGADYFSDGFAINAYMDASIPVSIARAVQEHTAIKDALEASGVKVIQVPPPENCQDGVYTANWGLCHGNKFVLSSLPNKRKDEEPYAEKVLAELGKELIHVPEGMRFSGQGDSLPCGRYVFMGSMYRTDREVHKFVGDVLAYEVVSLQTVPQRDEAGQTVTNPVTGWPDSFFYDLDLALAVLSPELIAWCPEAFVPESQERIRALPIEKIEVSYDEATKGFACNLVSTGETVIMSDSAPQFRATLEAKGFKTITPAITELAKGGGYIRCSTLTLD